MSHFTTTDRLGNTYHIYVKASGTVNACNQHRLCYGLSAFSDIHGNQAGKEAIAAAARQGLAALNAASFYTWTQA